MANLQRRGFIRGLAAIPALLAFSQKAMGEGPAWSILAQAARRSGRFYGVAARMDHISAIDPLREAVLRDCTSLTPEFHMNWDFLQPHPGIWNFAPADALCAFAHDHNMMLRGHSLLWGRSTPRWAVDAMSSGWGVVSQHFSTVVTRFDPYVSQWDVVNEAIDDNDRADGLRQNVFLQKFGPDYISRAFEEARARAPAARLMINDYGFEYDNRTERARRRLFLALLARLKRTNVCVGGVGLQAHLDLSKGKVDQKALSEFLAEIAAMGFDIVVSELDVKEQDLDASIEQRDTAVASAVTSFLDVALAQQAVKGVVTWGCSDRFSWLQSDDQLRDTVRRPEKLNRGLPYDCEFNPKRFYSAVAQALSCSRPTFT